MSCLSFRKAANRLEISIVLCVGTFVWGVGSASAPSKLTAGDYARAERFLARNAKAYVSNGDIQPHWIGKEERFWYLRTTTGGQHEFVVVDAASGKKALAFDHEKIANGLAKEAGRPVEAENLPFSSFRYLEGNAAIEFQLENVSWTCVIDTGSCSRDARDATAANEVLSPDGKWAAFVNDFNLWVRAIGTDSRFALTTDGQEHYGYSIAPGFSTHAVSDRRRAAPLRPLILWSPDSRYILTHQLDEREVKDLFLIQSVPEDGTLRPQLYRYRYALPGDEAQPRIEPVVFDVISHQAVRLSIPPLSCFIVTPVEKGDTWWAADSTQLYYLDRDRYSKSVSLMVADPRTGAIRRILRESSDTLVLLNSGSVFDVPEVKTLSNGDVIWYSQRDGWGHLYYYRGSSGVLRNRITRGDWTVRRIVRVDEAAKRIYFTASGRERGRDPYEQYLYSVRFDGSGMRLLTPEKANHEFAQIRFESSPDARLVASERSPFSPSGNYFIDSYSRPDTPPIFALRSRAGRLIQQLEAANISKLREAGYTPIEPFKVLAADGRTELYGNLFRPTAFDPSRKYPIIDSIYPGPQANRTQKSFMAATFDEYEAQSLAELGFIVVTVDGRGTPNRSKAFLEHSYGRLDKASDIEDHIAAIRQLADRYPYMDLARVGIDGASGGGYAAARALFSAPDFFKVAVSAEGNHDQRGYLAPWKETYEGLEQNGAQTEITRSNLSLASNLEGKLLLMHGEMDDNVSPTLTLKLVDALIKANKDFDLLIVPNGDHRAYLSPYFIRRKWDFFVRNLLGAEPPTYYSINQ